MVKNNTENLTGKPKGGKRFPKQALTDCLKWNKKLVSKTHLSPQPEDLILSGVVGSSSALGKVRISSMKQFGLIAGNSKAYEASKLGIQINSAPGDELAPLLKQAFSKATIFQSVFNTFVEDTVSKSKIKQRVSDLGVHPDKSDEAVEIYIESAVCAGLVTVSGDDIKHLTHTEMEAENSLDTEIPPSDDTEDQTNDTEDNADDGKTPDDPQAQERKGSSKRIVSSKPGVSVSINIDSSMDADKLSKQLELLNKFGVI